MRNAFVKPFKLCFYANESNRRGTSRPHRTTAARTEECPELFRSLRLHRHLTELHVQTHPQRPHPPLQTPRQECLLPARGVGTVAAAESRAYRRTEGLRGDRVRPSQTASEITARIGPTGPKPIGAAGLSPPKKAHRSP